MNKLSTCDERLQDIFNEVVKTWDCTIVCGHRNQIDQDKAYKEKKSTLKFPMSKHNQYPSKAVDVAPYPINWNDVIAFAYFAGYVKRVAHERGVTIRWGGDWDRDGFNKDQSFNDLPHFEIVD